MKTSADLYHATQTLFRAFCYLHKRMEPEETMSQHNADFLAGCILHACMAELLGEIRQRACGWDLAI